MNIGKWLNEFSKDLELKYNSEQTRKIYYSGVKLFLEHFKNEPQLTNNMMKNVYTPM